MAQKLVNQIQAGFTRFLGDAMKVGKGSKAAHRRARGESLKLETLLKAYRKQSISADKGTVDYSGLVE